MGGVYSLAQICKDGPFQWSVFSGAGDGSIKAWTVDQSGNLSAAWQLRDHNGPVRSLVVFGDGRLASGSDDTTIKIWDLTRRSCLKTFTEHTEEVKCLVEWTDGVLLSG